MKKYDEDLNTTLIFVSVAYGTWVHVLTQSQAGLFSAVTSAFIIEVNSQLQPDPNDETAALLRVLIHKIDNTTFGNDPPTLPQWTGPPQTIVQAQAILFASLSVSLFSAFLAMLGKQWLNRYASTDMRGTAIERSQNRQRKLDGVITWYFDHVMESLPLMLQIGLLLLGCALSRYLWGINITVASVVVGITSVGVIFYGLVVTAGVASESCPYQTPGARILRCTLLPALPVISKFSAFILSKSRVLIRGTLCYRVVELWWPGWRRPWYSTLNILDYIIWTLLLPIALVADLLRLGCGMVLQLLGSGWMTYRQLVDISRPRRYISDYQAIAPDFRCVSWMLQTSLDRVVHLAALKHLATTTTLAGFDPTIIVDCFNTFISCFSAIGNQMVVAQGLEQLAAVSTLCFFNTISHILVLDPSSSVLEVVGQRYAKVFPTHADFHRVHQFPHTLGAIHNLFRLRHGGPKTFQWIAYKPSAHEHTIVAHNLVKLALLEYERTEQMKIPRWILRFASHSLSLDPLPPTSVIASCLSIVAIDLGCDLSDAKSMTPDERWVHI